MLAWSDVIKGAFVKTGVCPLDRSAITADLLVGDTPKLNSNTKDGIDAVPLLLSSESTMQLGVFDDDGCIVDSPEIILPCKPSPTDGDGNRKSRVTSLVCSNCLQNDVTLHPAVRAGARCASAHSALRGSRALCSAVFRGAWHQCRRWRAIAGRCSGRSRRYHCTATGSVVTRRRDKTGGAQ